MEREPRFIVYTVSEKYNEWLSKGDSEVRRSTDDKKLAHLLAYYLH